MKNLREAVDMAKKCEDACADIEKHIPPGVIHEWKAMKLKWEKDVSKPDPYQVVEKGTLTIRTMLAVRLSLIPCL